MPPDASRPARFSALTAPRWRSKSTAFSRSPLVSCSALLQSIMPAPVRARSSATSFAGISFTVATLLTPPKNRRPRAARRGRAAVRLLLPGRARAGLAFAPAPRVRRGRRSFLRLEPRRDGFGLGPPLAPRRLLLLVALGLRLDAAGLGRVRRALALLGRLVQRHLVPRFPALVRYRRRDERACADPIAVSRVR